MFNIVKQELKVDNDQFIVESGRYARLCQSSVMINYGDTQVLATISVSDNEVVGDFLPLSVHYQEKFYAIGAFPGGFFKREAKPSENETLTSRLIDRPIRPLIDSSFNREIQLVLTVLSYDKKHSPDIAAMVAASAALSISGLPIAGTLASVRIGMINNEFVTNPTVSQMQDSKLDLVVTGTRDGILMVESDAEFLTEEQMLDALTIAHDYICKLSLQIDEFTSLVGKKELRLPENTVTEEYTNLYNDIKASAQDQLAKAYSIIDKKLRNAERRVVHEELKTMALQKHSEDLVATYFDKIVKSLEADIVRSNLVNHDKRIDGRGLSEIRNISAEVDNISQVHGSALFTRGETQALVITTLGTAADEQTVDTIHGDVKDRFLVHYNFPPYSVGEVGRLGAPGRREIGHGKLAYRALYHTLPSNVDFPYTVRLVSEVLESNGSSSMATVCGGTLSMMSAGIPIKTPISGIAMGLVKEGNVVKILTDILGDEDHLGDMDFKVAGSKDGITALQMDIKITSVTVDIMKQALQEAKVARNKILDTMLSVQSSSNANVNQFAPKIKKITIPQDKIGALIGPGGRSIKELSKKFDINIDINEDGTVYVTGKDSELLDKALIEIDHNVGEVKVGDIIDGPVVKVLEFGAFVALKGGVDGLVHISAFTSNRDEDLNKLVKVGDILKVEVLEIAKGRVKLNLLQK